MNFTAAAACNDRLAPIGPAGEKSLHKSSDVRLWHICEKPPRPAWVRFWVLAGHLFARQLRRSLTQSDHYTAGWTKLPSTPVGECAVRSILGREPMQRGTGYEVGCNRTWANASALSSAERFLLCQRRYLLGQAWRLCSRTGHGPRLCR